MSTMSASTPTCEVPVLGETCSYLTITHPFCYIEVRNPQTDQTKTIKFVVDTGLWASSIIKREVLDEIGLKPTDKIGIVQGFGSQEVSYRTVTLVAKCNGEMILSTFNVNPRGYYLPWYGNFDGALGKDDIKKFKIGIKLK